MARSGDGVIGDEGCEEPDDEEEVDVGEETESAWFDGVCAGGGGSAGCECECDESEEGGEGCEA